MDVARLNDSITCDNPPTVGTWKFHNLVELFPLLALDPSVDVYSGLSISATTYISRTIIPQGRAKWNTIEQNCFILRATKWHDRTIFGQFLLVLFVEQLLTLNNTQ